MVKSRDVRLLAGTLLLAALVAAPRGDGAGYALFEQGTKGMALGGAFVAQADDPSAMFYNPAGNAYNEKFTLYGGAVGVLRPTTNFTGSSPYPGDGYYTGMSKPLYWFGNGYAVIPLQPGKLNLAAGFWSPAGLGTPWANPDQFAGRYISQRADIRQVAASVQISWKVADWLAHRRRTGDPLQRREALAERRDLQPVHGPRLGRGPPLPPEQGNARSTGPGTRGS